MTIIYVAKATDGHQLRKKFFVTDGIPSEDKSKPFPADFEYAEHHVASLDDVYDLLTALADDPYRAIVMGHPTIRAGVRRSEYFEDQKSDFWIIDLDGVSQNHGEMAQDTIERCLPFLKDCGYVYAFSQSASIKEGLRARVICRTPLMGLADSEAYARHYNDLLVQYEAKNMQYIDSSIYERAKLIYTSRPELIGIADPHPTRVFRTIGDAIVRLDKLPDLVAVQMSRREKSDVMPDLTGVWGAGPGHSRSEAAWKFLVRLKAYMGDEFDDDALRRQHWHDAMKKAGALAEDFREYGDFADKRGPHVKIEPTETYTVMAVPNPDNSVPLETAERTLAKTLKEAIEGPPQTWLINVTMGTGKTREVYRQLAIHKRYLGQYDPLNEFYIDVYGPTIRMNEEAARTAQASPNHLTTQVVYGRTQEVDGEPVCYKVDAARTLQGIVDVAAHTCRSEVNGEEKICPFYNQCRWQDQRKRIGEYDVRIMAHEYLGLSLKQDTPRPPSVIVIDEYFGDMAAHTASVDKDDLLAERYTGEMRDWQLKFGLVLNGGLTLSALKDAGFTPDIFSLLVRAEESQRPQVAVSPEMDVETTNKAMKTYDPRWHRYASVWRRLRDSLIDEHLNRVRITEKHIVLMWKTPLDRIPRGDDGRPKVPVIILSGTARREVVDQFLKVDRYVEIDVAPHSGCRITQSDYSGAKTECLYGSSVARRDRGETEKEKIDGAAIVRDELAAHFKNAEVVITYKELEERMGLSDVVDVESAHFKAVEGLNAFEGKGLIVYGRPLPPPAVVEDIAQAIYQDDPTPIRRVKKLWYPQRAVARRGDGYAKTSYHPDTRAEAVRWMICEGELMQAIARARYVRHPAQILILNKTPLPLRVDRVISAARLHPDYERLEQSKTLTLSDRHLVEMFPVLKDSRTARREIVMRKEQFKHDRRAIAVEYRRTPKSKWSIALVDGYQALDALGDVEWRLAERTDAMERHNDWALNWRELFEHLPRATKEELAELDDAFSSWSDDEEGEALRAAVRGEIAIRQKRAPLLAR